MSVLRHAAALAIGILALQPSAHGAEDGIVTDRPDFVESSNVVGNGRFQIETSVAVDRSDNALLHERVVSTPTLLRYGIGDRFELRLETDGRSVSRSETMPHGEIVREAGYADVALGVKWHVADAEGKRPSLGLLVHADTPSGSRALRGHGVRPSLRVAAEWELPDDFSLGVMPGLARDTDEAGQHYVHGIFGIVLGKELSASVRGFVEIAAPHVARAIHGGTQATFDVGAAWLLSDKLQLDSMLSRGLNRRTPDLSWTVGLSFKR